MLPIKKKVRKEFHPRVRAILQSDLNARNKIMATNSLAIPIVTYVLTLDNARKKETRCQGQEMHHPKLVSTGFISEDLTEEGDCYNWN